MNRSHECSRFTFWPARAAGMGRSLRDPLPLFQILYGLDWNVASAARTRPPRERHSGAVSVAVDTLLTMDLKGDEVAALIADVIITSDHPQIASVQLDPSGPEGWCRLKVGFADGSTVFIGTAR